jgi:hypothetical protein
MLITHIVGINNKLKDKFIKDIDNISDKIIILDLDDISKKIMFTQEYSKIHDNFINTTDRALLSQLGNIWKNKFIHDVNLLIEQNKTRHIILIGLITFYLDHRIKINLIEPLKDKFFVNIDIKKYVTEILSYNIDTYRTDIITGKFPLKYLDYNFIKEQREELKAQYMIKDYKMKNYDAIINWISHKYNNILNDLPVNMVYYASYKRYENKIDILVGNTIVGYSDKWLALASLSSQNEIKRGLTYKEGENIPVLKELVPNGFSNLNKCCYLYELYPEKKVDNFRYIILDTDFINRYYVSNIKAELNGYKTIYQSYIL